MRQSCRPRPGVPRCSSADGYGRSASLHQLSLGSGFEVPIINAHTRKIPSCLIYVSNVIFRLGVHRLNRTCVQQQEQEREWTAGDKIFVHGH